MSLRLPKFNFSVELSLKFLRQLVDQLNRLVTNLDQVTAYDSVLIDSDITLLPGFQHRIRLVDTSGGDVTVTLPKATESVHMRLEIKHAVDGNTMHIVPASGDTLDGGTGISSVDLFDSFTVVEILGAWYVI